MDQSLPNSPWPQLFLERLRRIVPPGGYAQVVASFQQPVVTGFRINPLRCGIQATLAGLERDGVCPIPVAWCEHAFVVRHEQREALTHSPLVTRGDIYIQGLSSILAALVLDPRPGQHVLDLAAAPGGKATHLAALMNNQGWLSVVEPVRRRMFVLADNLKRAGVTISHTYLMDGRNAGDKVPERFERVMLDAPCSGEARFRFDQPATWQYWSLRKIREQSRKQRGLIRSAFRALKPGGQMLYGTCSFAPEENEAIVDGLLQEFASQACLLPIHLPLDAWQPGLRGFDDQTWSQDLTLARRILPNEMYNGFFLALIGKHSG